jgi:hypothetical protein
VKKTKSHENGIWWQWKVVMVKRVMMESRGGESEEMSGEWRDDGKVRETLCGAWQERFSRSASLYEYLVSGKPSPAKEHG